MEEAAWGSAEFVAQAGRFAGSAVGDSVAVQDSSGHGRRLSLTEARGLRRTRRKSSCCLLGSTEEILNLNQQCVKAVREPVQAVVS